MRVQSCCFASKTYWFFYVLEQIKAKRTRFHMCSFRNPDIKDGVNITQLLRCSQRKQVATSRLVSPRNDVWRTTPEIPYWWRVTTQIWVVLSVVLLIGCAAREICNQKHYPDLGSNVSSEWNFCARSSDVNLRETSSVVTKYRLFS